MTDTTASSTHDWASPAARRRVRRRYGADRRLQALGIGAILISLGLLVTLFSSLLWTGYAAFTTTKVQLEIFLDPAKIDAKDPAKANYRNIVRDAFLQHFPDVPKAEQRSLIKILISGAQYIVRDFAVANPDRIGQNVRINIPVSDPFDQLHKRIIPERIEALGGDRIVLYESLRRRGVLSVVDGRGVVTIDAFVDPASIDRANPASGGYEKMVREGFRTYFLGNPTAVYWEMIPAKAGDTLRDLVVADPSVIGRTIRVNIPLSEHYDALLRTGEATILNPRFSSEREIEWFRSLASRDLIATPFTSELFFNADSRFPELAGLAGALTGSFLTLLVCFLLSFPIGIAAAIYLEEFAPKSRMTDLIEVNINNLAAVPSVVFGLLGLAVFIGWFGLPRSAPIVGGMVLALMTLPTIIVATRAALKAVPPSIREAALGVGASKHQVMFHHVLPLAMPGILTGTIIGLAQALGETAPLLLIGMNAFIPSIENMGVLDPAMALPTQIYSWADSPERGFVSRTSAAILVLLGFLVVMNAIAVWLRSRLERTW
ncbi:MAG: phosphate ABC transporter permease PstA [Rhizobiales bacterium]|nr:phosphate ABC transporter permease PstA [Hyphomicrobiales bacterium]